MDNKSEIIEIFAGEYYQASMIKDLLEANGIEAFIENELMGNIAAWHLTSGGVAPVKIKIFKSDLALSKELIGAFNKDKG
jgi:hypothetical protein